MDVTNTSTEESSIVVDINDWQMGRCLGSSLREMFMKELWSDISFRCKDSDQQPQTDVKAHKLILAARSPVYQAMFYGPCADTCPVVELTDTDADTFKLFLKYLYTDSTDLTEESVPTVMQIAHKYQVTSLLTYCSMFLISILRPDNACAILELALFFGEKKLEEEAVNYIDDNGDEVLESDGFNDLQESTFERLLKGDTFVANENAIVTAAIKWAKNRCRTLGIEDETGPNIRKVLGDAFKHLRFPILTIEEFSNLTYRQGLLNLEELEETVSYITGNKNAKPFNTSRIRRCRAVKCRPRHIDPDFAGHVEFMHYVNVTCVAKVKAKDFLILSGFAVSSLVKSPTAPDFLNPNTMFTLGVSISKTQDGENLLFPKMFYNKVKTHRLQEFRLHKTVEMTEGMELYIIFHIMSDPHCMVLIPEMKYSNMPFTPRMRWNKYGPKKGIQLLEATHLDSWRYIEYITYESPSNR